MLAVTVALFTLLTPFVTPEGAPDIFTGPDDYSVDLGYQLNRGEAVLVKVFGLRASYHKQYVPLRCCRA